jgi:hypothetical protein
MLIMPLFAKYRNRLPLQFWQGTRRMHLAAGWPWSLGVFLAQAASPRSIGAMMHRRRRQD